MVTITEDLIPDDSDEYINLFILPKRELTYDLLLEAIRINPNCKLFIRKSPVLTNEQKEYLNSL